MQTNAGQALAPLLFHDTDVAAARANRSSPVVPTEPSPAAKVKKGSKKNADGLPVMAFADLIDHLGTLARNSVCSPLHKANTFTLYSVPTALQEAAFRLLDLDPVRVQ